MEKIIKTETIDVDYIPHIIQKIVNKIGTENMRYVSFNQCTYDKVAFTYPGFIFGCRENDIGIEIDPNQKDNMMSYCYDEEEK